MRQKRVVTKLSSAILAAVSLFLLSRGHSLFAVSPVEKWAQVRRVVDGDTVILTTDESLRYIGVDTPELHHPRKPVQAYAHEAKEFNRNLVEGKRIRLEFDVERYDKYRRLLAYVFLEDGTFVNADLLRQGYAQVLTIPPNVKYADLFLKYQREAREAKRGLWGGK